MSKEQTPITAEEFLKNNFCQNLGLRIDKSHRPDMYASDMMEQYAQAKVLEALEREFLELGLMAEFYYHDDGLEYYEAEVKPKYEK